MLVAMASVTLLADRVIESIDDDWRFHPGDVPGAEQPEFADASWRRLAVPHDWAFEAVYAEDAAQADRGGYKPGGIGWYRREFHLEPAQVGHQLRVEFDAVYMNSEVWLNGRKVGRRPYGYISFGYDLTPHLRSGRNVLALRVDNSLEPSARRYHGCVIYGHVRLVATGGVRIAPSGVFVQSPVISDTAATVVVRTEVHLRTRLLAPDGTVAAEENARVGFAAGY